MALEMNRRVFLGATAGLTAGMLWTQSRGAAETPAARIGIIGVGNRGCALLDLLLSIEGVVIPAIGDIAQEAIARATEIIRKAGRPDPEAYSRDEQDYKRLLEREDLDGIIIATPWNWHASMAVAAMRAGKPTGVEVPAALSIEECWQLIDTHEETKIPCIMLENWSFRRDNLAVLNMVRQGLLGDIIHARCAYAHDCMNYYFRPDGTEHWGVAFLEKYNRDQYPTHGQGPVLSWMNINCGDVYESITSSATAARGINAHFLRTKGPDHPNSKRPFAQGDIVTSTVRTKMGRTISITYDVLSPRPYDNQWQLQGTQGIYSHEHDAVYLEGRSPEGHAWEPFAPYQQQFDHPWWASMDAGKAEKGHGGADYVELALFVKSIREKTPFPLDIYDAVTMSSIVALSGQSIAQGGVPVACPDFTRGAWKSRKPAFGLTT